MSIQSKDGGNGGLNQRGSSNILRNLGNYAHNSSSRHHISSKSIKNKGRNENNPQIDWNDVNDD